MKIVKIIPLYMMLIFSMLTILIAASFGYAYFDNLSKTESESVQIGEWSSGGGFLTYIADFESYTGASGNVDINGKIWSLASVALGNTINDNYNETSSLRMIKKSEISTVDGFKGAKFISFYYGKTKDSPDSGKTIKLTMTINGSTSVDLISGALPGTFNYVEFDLSYLYVTGTNGTPISPDSIITFAFSFAGQTGKPSIRQDLNIDDIVIIYRP